jgi:hypothetical protein
MSSTMKISWRTPSCAWTMITRAQCLFCPDIGLAANIRTRCFANALTVTRHVAQATPSISSCRTTILPSLPFLLCGQISS